MTRNLWISFRTKMWLILALAAAAPAAFSPRPVLAGDPNMFRVYLGPWSPCKAPKGSSRPANQLTFEPNLGEQVRSVTCRTLDKTIVNCKLVGETPPQVRTCVLSEDCVLSEWSEWLAPARCPSAPAAPRERARAVLALPQGGGSPCGALREANATRGPAHAPPELVRWAPGPWEPCRVHRQPSLSEPAEEGARCGGGLQRRELTCVDRFRRVILPDSACSVLTTPLLVQRCEVPCPRDCAVGGWGSWGPCEPISGCPMTPVEEITATGYRKRTRRVIVAGSAGGAECGALAEVQACGAPACARWAPSTWGPCRLPAGLRCGPGHRERRLLCRDLQGGELSEEQCASSGTRPVAREGCRVACPRDCVLSPWGPWGPCSRPCSSRHHRALRYRNRTVVAPAGEGGEQCKGDAASLQQEEECNTQGCQGYSWLNLPWQPCSPRGAPENDIGAEEPEADEAGEDGEGGAEPPVEPCGPLMQQSREVWCMENSDRRVADSHCSPLRKPETLRTCDKPCSEPCKLSPWSPWTPCPLDCEGGVQDRERTLESGWGRTESCGALRERRACAAGAAPPAPLAHPAPHWAHGAWSSCQLPAGLACGDGIMTRGVWCSLQHHKVNVGACAGSPPASALRCSVDCHSRCQLSAWSPWSPCTESCAGVTTRSRKKLGDAPCPNTVLYEGYECPCNGFHAQLVGPWSSCIVSPPVLNSNEVGILSAETGECGTGRRYRRAVCLDPAGRAVEPHWCREYLLSLVSSGPLAGLLAEECAVPCEVDCHVSRWSAWGPCLLPSVPCGVGVQRRTRNILVNATRRGRPCGETRQSKVCSKPCEQFAWEAGGWSACALIPRQRARGCGTGDQNRSVRCVDLSSGGTVADALCDPSSQPADLNACHVPCPGECVLSDWSDWSQCAAPCSRRAQRDRTRALLRSGAPGQLCAPLVQAQPCLLNRTCFHYHWRITPWGACLPLGGSPCGEGMQQRAIYCERNDGRQVNNSFCDSYSRPVEPTDQFCYVDCPIDCELSPWEPWITKLCVCGVHTNNANDLLRFRRVVTPASPQGRPCPAVTVQSVACPLRPCYVTIGDQWSTCQLEAGATCGYGYKSRNITCVRETDKQHVPLSYCGLNTSTWQDLYEEESCYVECYTDCKNPQWENWSPCDSHGVRFRKRNTFRPEGPPCTPHTTNVELFEYVNCNVSLETDWASYNYEYDDDSGDGTTRTPTGGVSSPEEPDYPKDDIYYYDREEGDQQEDQPEKTYLLFAASDKRTPTAHTALAVGIASAAVLGMLVLLYLTVRCHKRRIVHKV